MVESLEKIISIAYVELGDLTWGVYQESQGYDRFLRLADGSTRIVGHMQAGPQRSKERWERQPWLLSSLVAKLRCR